MPDWFYRTVSRPLLFRLPAEQARDLALGFMGRLARLPGGGRVIDFLGHMRPDTRLQREVGGLVFPSPVGLASGIDAEAAAVPALARFGFGFLEVGPVTWHGQPGATPLERRLDVEAIWFPEPSATLAVETLAHRLDGHGQGSVPVIARIAPTCDATPEQATDECQRLIDRLTPQVAAFNLASVDRLLLERWTQAAWQQHVASVGAHCAAAKPSRPLLVSLPADLEPARAEALGRILAELGVRAVFVDGTTAAGLTGRCRGAPARGATLALVRRLHDKLPGLAIIAAGGVHEPEHALDLLRAGASLVAIDSGLVYSGPGLPKRVNEAILHSQGAQADPAACPPLAQSSWFWTLLLGVSMLLGGLMAMAIAVTRVVLPYDEAQVGMSRAQLLEINSRLLAFMTHDRVTLAGTMFAVAILYLGLSWFGVRRGQHWAKIAVVASAFTGFFSFFLFLGFGYFDPFHAFVTSILFQFLLLALYSPLPPAELPAAANLREDWRWRWSLWGQLLFIIHGVVLIVAGSIISLVGVTQVFVPEDLMFMDTTAEALRQANPHLVPMIAHDRASFGGMLIATGVAVLLTSLWGLRQGQSWQWWMLLLAGSIAYLATIIVHLAVGYDHLGHLLPAYGGFGLLIVGLVLLYPYLCAPESAHARAA